MEGWCRRLLSRRTASIQMAASIPELPAMEEDAVARASGAGPCRRPRRPCRTGSWSSGFCCHATTGTGERGRAGDEPRES